MDETAARALVRRWPVARLATHRADGGIDLVPFVYAMTNTDTLVSAVDHKPKRTTRLQRLANIERNPDVTVLVDHYEDDWSELWWVRINGDGACRRAGTRAHPGSGCPRWEVPPVPRHQTDWPGHRRRRIRMALVAFDLTDESHATRGAIAAAPVVMVVSLLLTMSDASRPPVRSASPPRTRRPVVERATLADPERPVRAPRQPHDPRVAPGRPGPPGPRPPFDDGASARDHLDRRVVPRNVDGGAVGPGRSAR